MPVVVNWQMGRGGGVNGGRKEGGKPGRGGGQTVNGWDGVNRKENGGV